MWCIGSNLQGLLLLRPKQKDHVNELDSWRLNKLQSNITVCNLTGGAETLQASELYIIVSKELKHAFGDESGHVGWEWFACVPTVSQNSNTVFGRKPWQSLWYHETTDTPLPKPDSVTALLCTLSYSGCEICKSLSTLPSYLHSVCLWWSRLQEYT